MYPLVLYFGILLTKKSDRNDNIGFGISMSIIGALLAGVHYIFQITKTSSVSCSVVGYSESCSQFFVLTYGYITIPMMALTAFLAIVVLGYMGKVDQKSKG